MAKKKKHPLLLPWQRLRLPHRLLTLPPLPQHRLMPLQHLPLRLLPMPPLHPQQHLPLMPSQKRKSSDDLTASGLAVTDGGAS